MHRHNTKLTSFFIAVLTFVTLQTSLFAQTVITPPENSYQVEADVTMGKEAAREAEAKFPLLKDASSNTYVQNVGDRLVQAIPTEFQHSEFRYRFKIINASDINAFSLPGGPMYLNRGMIDAAKNEGEMVGVMAHEIAHVALRHGTATVTQMEDPLIRLVFIAANLAGWVIGGDEGAAIGRFVFQTLLVNPYSREYESQADILATHIMLKAGYDPQDFLGMLKNIDDSSSADDSDWFSTHPSTAKRLDLIKDELKRLKMSPDPVRDTEQFKKLKGFLKSLPPAQTMEELQKRAKPNRKPPAATRTTRRRR